MDPVFEYGFENGVEIKLPVPLTREAKEELDKDLAESAPVGMLAGSFVMSAVRPGVFVDVGELVVVRYRRGEGKDATYIHLLTSKAVAKNLPDGAFVLGKLCSARKDESTDAQALIKCEASALPDKSEAGRHTADEWDMTWGAVRQAVYDDKDCRARYQESPATTVKELVGAVCRGAAGQFNPLYVERLVQQEFDKGQYRGEAPVPQNRAERRGKAGKKGLPGNFKLVCDAIAAGPRI